ncbi:MAG: phage Gp37/Gp68 family protein [Gammaproteobacteria bacterium]|nr:phage Gp37/Gp68 family protein [Gammaproteobacteria bacterium]
MSENTGIEWADHTFNPWIGCQKVAPECDNCYAEAQNNHRKWNGGTWGPKSPRKRTSVTNWKMPIRWNNKAAAFFAEHGRRQRVFCASLADVFDNAVDPAWRAELFELIRATPNLDWMLLTKRPQNMAEMLPNDWDDGWDNVWLGTSAGTQKTADMNIPHLLNTPAAIRFVSAEPLLEKMDLHRFLAASPFFMTKCEKCGWIGASSFQEEAPTGCGDSDVFCHKCGDYTDCDEFSELDWVIVGGESGPNARPMQTDWATSIKDQCGVSGVKFFMKQMGGKRKPFPPVPDGLDIKEHPISSCE